MKNLLYIISGLLLVIWGILFWGLNASGSVHIIPVVAMFIVLVALVFKNQLSNKSVKP